MLALSRTMLSTAQEIPPGTLVSNRYRVLSPLGKGGMGSVVAAEDTRTGRRVAVKYLLTGHCNSLPLVARFRREARATIRLRSEHIAHVLDAGEHLTAPAATPIPYLVMEYLEGHDLRRVMQLSGPLSVELAADYAIQACAGLAEAHALGIVHRDIKPANLFLARLRDGRKVLKILDFGVAKFESPSTSGDDEDMTHGGETVGSFSYMAPEQMIDASTVDCRADIWSLGVLLYHLTTGEKPFNGETPRDVVISIMMEDQCPIRAHRPDLPAAFAEVVHRCLAKRSGDRPASVVELARALSPFAAGRSRSAPDAQMFLRTAPLPDDLFEATQAPSAPGTHQGRS